MEAMTRSKQIDNVKDKLRQCDHDTNVLLVQFLEDFNNGKIDDPTLMDLILEEQGRIRANLEAQLAVLDPTQFIN